MPGEGAPILGEEPEAIAAAALAEKNSKNIHFEKKYYPKIKLDELDF